MLIDLHVLLTCMFGLVKLGITAARNYTGPIWLEVMVVQSGERTVDFCVGVTLILSAVLLFIHGKNIHSLHVLDFRAQNRVELIVTSPFYSTVLFDHATCFKPVKKIQYTITD